MRLIDADKLPKTEIYDEDGKAYCVVLEEDIDQAQTVNAIPIDKPFLKMRYGDYVVYNKKWLVNHLQTEWNILQGKEYQPSIPIEWIERKLAEHWYVDYDIREMLDDWEKENERETN